MIEASKLVTVEVESQSQTPSLPAIEALWLVNYARIILTTFTIILCTIRTTGIQLLGMWSSFSLSNGKRLTIQTRFTVYTQFPIIWQVGGWQMFHTQLFKNSQIKLIIRTQVCINVSDSSGLKLPVCSKMYAHAQIKSDL